jgi:hypothetical protein
MSAPINYTSIRDDLRAVWLGQKSVLDRAISGEIKRSPEQIERYRSVLASIGIAGAELVIIAANAASYEAWKRTLGRAA